MKAKILKNPSGRTPEQPAVVAVNLKDDHIIPLTGLCKRRKVKLIITEELHTPIDCLLDGKGVFKKPISDGYPDTESECILLAGLPGAELSEFLDDMKSSGISISLKAMHTPHNRSWTMAHLIAELTEEFRFFKNGGRPAEKGGDGNG